jgi:protocatechuate 3,4-dioxygenase beta subunit
MGSKSFRRLVTLGATTAVLAGMSPLLGVVAANAAPGAIILIDPCAGPCTGATAMSTMGNGTDSSVHLYADVLQATGGNALFTSVNFTYVDDTINALAAPTTIVNVPVHARTAGLDELGYDSYAVGSWTPPVNGDMYTVSAEAIDANSVTVQSTSSATLPAVNNQHDAYVTQPTDGGMAGYYAHTGKINMAGTATNNGDPVTIGDGHAADVGATIYDGTSDHWAGDFAPTAISPASVPTASASKEYGALFAADTAGGGNRSQLRPATVYLQSFGTNGFAMNPLANFSGLRGSLTEPGGGTPSGAITANGRQPYLITATDQHGHPISGLPFTVQFTPGQQAAIGGGFQVDTVNLDAGAPTLTRDDVELPITTTPYTLNGTTDAFGRFEFTVSDNTAETVGVQAQSEFSGAFNPGVDYTLNGSFSTVVQTPASATATIVGHPTAPLYASQTYGPNGTPGNGPSPEIQVVVKNAGGNVIPNATVNYSVVRNVTWEGASCGDANTYPMSTPSNPATSGLTSTTSDGNGVIWIEPQSALLCPNAEAGSDTFTIYIEKNGSPGYQSGTSDILVGTEKISYGPESIYFQPCDQITTYAGGNDPQAGATEQACKAQQEIPNDLSLTISASIYDGTTRQPISGRKIDISFPAGTHQTFSSANGSALALVNPQEGDITTDANGHATVILNDKDVETVVTTASDPTLLATTSDNATDTVSWLDYKTTLNTVSTKAGGQYVGEITPLSEHNTLVGSPGQPLVEGFNLKDQNGNALSDTAVTITTGAGFLTDLPNVVGIGAGANTATYKTLHFDTAPADQALVKGDVHSNGTSESVVTNNAGDVFFALGDGADPSFNDDGNVNGNVTVQLGTSGNTLTLPDNSGTFYPVGGVSQQTLFSTKQSLYHVAALNPGTFTLVEGTFDNNGRFHVGTSAPSGNKATTGENTVPVDEVDTVAVQTDSFGNRVSEPISFTSSGVTASALGGAWGSYTDLNNTTAESNGFEPTDECESNEAALSDGACPELLDSPGADLYINQLLNPASSSPLTGSETVTDTWSADHTTWLVDATTGDSSINVITTPAETVSYTVTWYDREASSFIFKLTATPTGNTHKVNTPVSYSVNVVDSLGRAVNGLGVEFIEAGPGGQTKDTGNPWTCDYGNGGCRNSQFTDTNGNAGFTFVSTDPGTYTVTAVLTDGSGNEIGRTSKTGTYTGPSSTSEKPTLRLTSSKGHVTVHVTSHPTVKGITVHVFFKKNGTWHRVGSTKTGSKGHASLTHKETAGKKLTFRAQVVGSPKAHAGYTSAKSITVK